MTSKNCNPYNIIIPARYGSTRLPGKLLLPLAGKPILQHVYERACQTQASNIIIATDDTRIAEVAHGFGAKVCMTDVTHISATARLKEVIDAYHYSDETLLVNVQGDEPLIPPRNIDYVAALLAEHPQAGVATLCEPITSKDVWCDPHVCKVVRAENGMALYFSRAPIPCVRDEETVPASARRHIGLYAYRASAVHAYSEWDVPDMEEAEKLEQLRFLNFGVPIYVGDAPVPTPTGVDTEADYERLVTSLT